MSRRDSEEITGQYSVTARPRPKSNVQEVQGLPPDMPGRIEWLSRKTYGIGVAAEELLDAVGILPEKPSYQHPEGLKGRGLLNEVFWIKANVEAMARDIAALKAAQTTGHLRLSNIEGSIDLNTAAIKSAGQFTKVVGLIVGIAFVAAEVAWGGYRSGAFDNSPPVPQMTAPTK